MDLSKQTDEKKLSICRTYFRLGFAFLPLVWAINAIWFFKEAFRRPEFEGQKDLKRYVLLSAIGASLWAIVLLTWVTIFQINRESWGEFADRISFIIPLGG